MRYLVLVLLGLLVPYTRAEPSVHILAETLEQVVTSTTLEWVPSSSINDALIKNAVVGSNQTIEGTNNSIV